MSVGLLVVPFQNGLYVFVHLSKWFVFVLMFKFWSVCRCCTVVLPLAITKLYALQIYAYPMILKCTCERLYNVSF